MLSLLSWIVLTLAVFGLAFIPLRGSQDEWWHLKTGQWIWQHKQLPLNDIFTYTGENIRWYNHEWLSQLSFYGSYHSFGDSLAALILFKSIIVVLVFLLVAMLARQRSVSWPTACTLALIGADISRRTINPRPPIFSYLLMAIFLLVFYAWKRGKLRFGSLWLLVPVTILWANFHGMVLLSFLIAGAFAGGELLDNLSLWLRDQHYGLRRSFSSIFTRPFWGLSILTLLLMVACMAQPSGYHIFFLGRNFTADPLLQKIILEMMPTPAPFAQLDPTQPWWHLTTLIPRPPGFWTFWVALFLGAILFLRNRLRLPYGADYLLLFFFTYQGVMHWRLLPLFAIAAAAPAASLVYERVSHWNKNNRSIEAPLFTAILLALFGWFNFMVAEPPPQTFFDRNMALVNGKTGNLSDYPEPVMDYIIEAKLPPRMFSDSNYCGYAIWRLSPEHYKLFTDNRFDVFGSKFVREERTVFYAANPGDTINGEPVTESWEQILYRYDVNFIVFRPLDHTHLFNAIMDSDNWRMVYYYIAPEAPADQYPLAAYYVWIRNNNKGNDIARRSEIIFKKQFPGKLVPSLIVELIRLKLGMAKLAVSPIGPADGDVDWKVPLN